MNTRELRIQCNNEWPTKIHFPAEKEFIEQLKKHNLQQALSVAQLGVSEQYEFQFYLGYLIDALEMLPLRPDLAFDHLWKALDAEFFIVQSEINDNNIARFDAFVDKVMNDPKAASSFLEYLSVIPYQTCEYAAKRIIKASSNLDSNHNKTLFSRAQNTLGQDFCNAFISKYPPSTKGKPSPDDQRKAGRLLKLIFINNTVELSGKTYSFTETQKAKFLIKVVLTNYRNERFHGDVFSSTFRSSTATLKTYSHAYYLLHISYALLLDVFLYREYGVIKIEDVRKVADKNIKLFSSIFDNIQ